VSIVREDPSLLRRVSPETIRGIFYVLGLIGTLGAGGAGISQISQCQSQAPDQPIVGRASEQLPRQHQRDRSTREHGVSHDEEGGTP